LESTSSAPQAIAPPTLLNKEFELAMEQDEFLIDLLEAPQLLQQVRQLYLSSKNISASTILEEVANCDQSTNQENKCVSISQPDVVPVSISTPPRTVAPLPTAMTAPLPNSPLPSLNNAPFPSLYPSPLPTLAPFPMLAAPLPALAPLPTLTPLPFANAAPLPTISTAPLPGLPAASPIPNLPALNIQLPSLKKNRERRKEKNAMETEKRYEKISLDGDKRQGIGATR